ncbi:hypothetical protein ACPCAK_13320 [Streptomyces cellulosae]
MDDYLTVVLSNGDVLRWDVEKLEIVSHFNPDPEDRRPDRVAYCEFSSSGRYYACSEIGKPLAVWRQDLYTGRFDLCFTASGDAAIDFLSVADIGATLHGNASSRNLWVLRDDPSSLPVAVPLDRFATLGGSVKSAVISSTGRAVAYASEGKVEVASFPRYEIIGSWSCRVGRIRTLKFSQDDHYLAVGGSEGVEMLELRGNRGARVKLSRMSTHSLAFSGQRQISCIEANGVSAISLNDGRVVYRKDASGVSMGAFSLDASMLAVVREREVELWG